MTYVVFEYDPSGVVVARTPVIGGFVVTFIDVQGSTSVVTIPPTGGADPLPPAAVGYLWPRGDGTPAAS